MLNQGKSYTEEHQLGGSTVPQLTLPVPVLKSWVHSLLMVSVRSLHDVHEMNTYRAGPVCPCFNPATITDAHVIKKLHYIRPFLLCSINSWTASVV